jgi:hypothetical protein
LTHLWPPEDSPLPPEDRTARLTILIDPRKKAVFERVCAEEDSTPSQVLRRLIRRHIEERTGRAWVPPVEEVQSVTEGSVRRRARSSTRRASSKTK